MARRLNTEENIFRIEAVLIFRCGVYSSYGSQLLQYIDAGAASAEREATITHRVIKQSFVFWRNTVATVG